MNAAQLKETLTNYRTQLANHGLSAQTPQRCDTSQRSVVRPERRRHLLWMIDTLLADLKHAPVDVDVSGKANRWLGFIQGVLWADEYRSIDEMREDNR